MKRHFRLGPGLLAAAMALPLLGSNGHAAPAMYEFVAPHGESAIFSADDAAKFFPPGNNVETHRGEGIDFTITYEDWEDGFYDPVYGAAARENLYEVLTYVSSVLAYNGGELDIHVNRSEFDGTGALASAGTVFFLYPGIHPGATLHRLNTGEKLLDDIAEIGITVDFGRPYAFGPEAPADDELDFRTILLHEVTHGIGFVTRIGRDGHSVYFGNAYSVYDALLTNRGGTPVLTLDGPVPAFQLDPEILTGFDVAFGGAYASAQSDDGRPVPVFASPPFSSGSSLGHWAFGSVVGDVLMEPRLGPGVMHRTYTAQDLGAVYDLRNYSRGDGSPGDGPSGCSVYAGSTANQQSAGDVMLFSLVILAMFSVRKVTNRQV